MVETPIPRREGATIRHTAIVIAASILTIITIAAVIQTDLTRADHQWPCQLHRKDGLPNLPISIDSYWWKSEQCLMELPVSYRVKDVVRSRGNNTFAYIQDPHNKVLYKYDYFQVTETDGRPWKVTLSTPVTGMWPFIQIWDMDTFEIVSQSPIIHSGSLSSYFYITDTSTEWTPVKGKEYWIVLMPHRGFTESPFTLSYEYADVDQSIQMTESTEQGEFKEPELTDEEFQQMVEFMKALEAAHDD